MKNFMLTVFGPNNETHADNLGRYSWGANKVLCLDSVKRVAFARLMFNWPEYYWSYEGNGWIVGDPKPGKAEFQIRAFLSVEIEDIVL